MDPIIASARHVLRATLDDLRPSLEGLTTAELNRRPGGDDTNSIAVLAVHSLTSTRWWLSVATGSTLPDRDRDSEFLARADNAAALMAWFEDMGAQCVALLDATAGVDWGAVYEPDPGQGKVTASFALIHAMSHLREHEGQMSLTRQLLALTG